jgi:1-acyl-sn-glycerol-3-phosphate acyltransferase
VDIEQRIHAGEGVVVFPEGTSSPGHEILPFRSSFFEGAARSGREVHCVSLAYATPEGAPPAHLAICWWGEMTFADHLYELLGLRGFEVCVKFAEKPLGGGDRKHLARAARRTIEELFTASATEGR